MNAMILISDDGFEIPNPSKHYLSRVGGLLFLRFNGYLAQENIINCVKKHPKDMQNEVNTSIAHYSSILFNLTSLKNEDAGLHIFISKFPIEHLETLFVLTSNKYKPLVKKILSDIVFK